MAQSIGTMALKLILDPRALFGSLGRASSTIAAFAASTTSTLSKLATAPFTAAVKGLGAIGLAAEGIRSIGSAFDVVVLGPIKLAAAAEQAQISFEIMLGSAQKAQDLLKDLNEFAAATPFETPDLIKGAEQLLTFGIAGEKVVDTLKLLGNVAGTPERLKELTFVFGQVRSQGRAMAEDLNQFAQRGVPIFASLAQVLKVNENQVKELASQGRVGFNEIARAFMVMNEPGSRFAGMLQAQSQSLNGLWSTLVDNFKMAMTRVGQIAVESTGLKGLLRDGIAFTDWLRENIEKYARPAFEALGGVIQGMAGTVKELWQTLLPGLEAFGSTLAGQRGVFQGFRDFTVDALEAVSQAVGKLVVAFEHIGDTIRSKFFARMLEGSAEVANVMAALLDPIGVGLNGAGLLRGAAGKALREAERLRGSSPELAAAEKGMEDKVKGFFDRVRDKFQKMDEETRKRFSPVGLALGAGLPGVGLGGLGALAGLGGLPPGAAAAPFKVPDITDPLSSIRVGRGGAGKLAEGALRGTREAEELISKFQNDLAANRGPDPAKEALGVAKDQLKQLGRIEQAVLRGGASLALI